MILYLFMAPPAMYWLLCALSRTLDLSPVIKPYMYQSELFFNLFAFSYHLAGLFPEAVVGIGAFAAFAAVLAFHKDNARARRWLAWGAAVTVLAYLVILAPYMLGIILSTPGRPGFGW